MAFNSAESNRAIIRYIPEVVWGTTPGSGVTRTMRITSSSLAASKETVVSDELRADRMVPNIVEVSAMTGGDVEFEMSCGSQDDFFQDFLLGTWSTTMNHFLVKGPSVTVTGTSQITITGADYTNYLADGQYIKLEGFQAGENNGYFSINGAPSFSGGNTVITVDETSLVVEAGSSTTRIYDANDVILKSTLTAITSGNTINGGGANSFAGASFQVGDKIYIEGLGKESGTITAEATDPTEGDTFTVSDGTNSITFEIRTNSALVAPGNVHVAFSGTEATLAASINAAINAQFALRKFKCYSTVSSAVVTVVNGAGVGGSITESSTGLTVVDFTGGDAQKFGEKTIASIPNDDTIVTVETLTVDANAGGATVVIKHSHIRNPGDFNDIVKRSISAETGFTDVSKFLAHDGLRVGSFQLSVTAGEIVNGSFSFMGAETVPGNSTVIGDTGSYTVLDTTATEVLNATSNVGTVKKDGVALTTAVTSIELNGDAALREQRAVGEKFPCGIGYGRFSMTGTIEAYFVDFSLYNAFLNHETASLEFDFTDIDGFRMIFRVPAVKFTSDPVAPGGIDEDIMESIEWSAQRDPTYQTMMMIDRFSPTWPMSAA